MSAKYTEWIKPEGLEKVKGWAAAGLTSDQIAANMGVTRKTLYDWRGKFPEFAAALDEGSGDAVREVESALFKKAIGYTVDLVKTFKVRRVEYDRYGKKIAEREELVQGIDQTHVPADVQAQKFFLTNKAPEDWKNKVDVDGSLNSGGIEEYLKKLEEGKPC